MIATDPENLHRLFAERASVGDIDGLMSLYEDGAAFVGPDGIHAAGRTAIREHIEGLLALSPHITPISSESVLAGDVALISNRWRMSFGSDDGQTGIEGKSTEVARCQTDGSWRYVIDNPSSADVLPNSRIAAQATDRSHASSGPTDG